jgi:hypothetical protein
MFRLSVGVKTRVSGTGVNSRAEAGSGVKRAARAAHRRIDDAFMQGSPGQDAGGSTPIRGQAAFQRVAARGDGRIAG